MDGHTVHTCICVHVLVIIDYLCCRVGRLNEGFYLNDFVEDCVYWNIVFLFSCCLLINFA